MMFHTAPSRQALRGPTISHRRRRASEAHAGGQGLADDLSEGAKGKRLRCNLRHRDLGDNRTARLVLGLSRLTNLSLVTEDVAVNNQLSC